jgi:hypothetical protein
VAGDGVVGGGGNGVGGLNYTAPPEQVVYDENNGTVSPLIGTAGYRGQPAFSLNGSTAPTVAVRPTPELGNYFAAMQYPLWAPPATIFMHEMRTKSGQVRLVAVMRWPVNTSYILYEFGLTPTVIKPAELMSRPVIYPVRRGNWSLVQGASPADMQNLRFYAGQVDPADLAHFTIKYDLRGGSGMIDGRLNEDGVTVSLKIVSGPAVGTRWVVDGGRH